MMELLINKMQNGKANTIKTITLSEPNANTNNAYVCKCVEILNNCGLDWDCATLYNSSNQPKQTFVNKASGLKYNGKYAIYL